MKLAIDEPTMMLIQSQILVVDGNEWQGNSNSLVSQTVDNSLAKLSFINLSSNYSVGWTKS